jgi:hypothetical protein
MSKAYQCDRCAAFEPDEPIVIVQMKAAHPDRPQRSTSYEMCNHCLTELVEWLDAFAEQVDEPVDEKVEQ